MRSWFYRETRLGSWVYAWLDRREVSARIRSYKKHPELYELDRDAYESGAAGYEE